MNYSSNRNINLNVYTENDVLVLEKAVKSAISAVMDAIYRVSDAKMTEYQRMVAEKDKEISRLEVKLQQTENEVKAFVSQRGLCDSLSGQDDICVNLGNNASDGRPYGENQMTNEQDVKMDFPSLGTRTTPSVSAQCEDGVSAASSIQLVLEEQISLPSERTTDLVSPASQVTSPVVKEEPSSVETVFIKWEMCEQSFGGRQEGKQGQGCCGQSPTKKSLGTRTPPSVSAQCEEGVSAASSIQLVLEEQISLSSERTTDLVSPASQVTSPVVKEEPSSVETVFIKWEMCEQSFGGHQEGKQGQGCRGQSPTKKRGYNAGNSNSPQSSSSSSTTSTLHRRTPVDNNWHFSFEIPWGRMPLDVTRKLDNKERPTGRERREVIRLIVGEILTTCPTPGKKHLSEIARKIVSTYPLSFRDVIEDQVVGSGYDSITKQLQARVDNLKRGNTPLSQKRQASSASQEDPSSKRMRLDYYGCINWQPGRLPPGETTDTQKCTQEELKKMYKNGSKDAKSIENKMVATFYSQRRAIISGMETSVLGREWPYLFETSGMKTHFKELTGVDVDKEAMASKCERVISYLKSRERRRKIEDILAGMEIAKEKLLDVTLPGSLLLLLKHFNEQEDQMFLKVDEMCLPSEVDQLPSTPCIVVCGSSPLTAERFMVSVDQTIVNGSISNFSDALLLMFAAYYCLNISYPAELRATLEFLQRCLFKINPDKGSKVEKKPSKKQQAVSPKVLSLISNIADYEWRE